MTLEQLKRFIESFPDDHAFPIRLSEPFSWRGLYSDVAFSIENYPSVKEYNLEMIDQATRGKYYGWKGGEYSYDLGTEVHFEQSESSYSFGEYETSWLFKLLKESLQ